MVVCFQAESSVPSAVLLLLDCLCWAVCC